MSIGQNRILNCFIILAALGLLSMAGAIISAVIAGDFWGEFTHMANMPWGFVSIVDIYIGLFIFCAWVLWREKFGFGGLVWTLLIICFGNIISCAYVIMAASTAKGNIKRFWLGRYDERISSGV